MRVMVTGATTPLGAAIVDHLLAARDVELVLAVGPEPAPPAPRAAGERIVYRSADLAHARGAHDLVWGPARELAIEAVVSATPHRHAREHGRAGRGRSVEAVRNLLRALSDHPTIRRFVYRGHADVYAPGRHAADLLDEDTPLDLDPAAPRWVRERVEADLIACAHLAGPVELVVLRCAELFAPGCGSPLWAYLSSPVCVRPLGFDPMLDLLSLDDAAAAVGAALASPRSGVFNIPGYDRLPLSRAIEEAIRFELPLPGPVLAPLSRLRRLAALAHRDHLDARRLHLGGVLDGTRARLALGYVPRTPVEWPVPWWRRLADQLDALHLEPEA